ncbi:hypothetical protein Cgig2_021307 [Carnegiea gigantea]|uniref:Uncharacterized protein n=1 Tax=Carnegiea gigantea TaxID=171969 RepID=A0A9Q1JIZ6_9CARY|nr:hypothetical protein Cgig2_021307 [Carnegiea gigantea]
MLSTRGSTGLSKIGSIIGIPIKIDRYTKNKYRIRYARLLIEIYLEGPFLEFIEFFKDNKQVNYEWLPTKCNPYQMFGHEEETYKKKGGTRKKWRKVQKDPPEAELQGNLDEGARSNGLHNVRSFLHTNRVGLIGLLETKVKEKNAGKVAVKTFLGWQRHHNFSLNTKACIWIGWKPYCIR